MRHTGSGRGDTRYCRWGNWRDPPFFLILRDVYTALAGGVALCEIDGVVG